MSSDRRVTCQCCGGHERDVGAISWRGKCARCSIERLNENVAQMRARSGPNWTRWRQAMAACVGGALLDDQRDSA